MTSTILILLGCWVFLALVGLLVITKAEFTRKGGTYRRTRLDNNRKVYRKGVNGQWLRK